MQKEKRKKWAQKQKERKTFPYVPGQPGEDLLEDSLNFTPVLSLGPRVTGHD
jgi:hypothetical protein